MGTAQGEQQCRQAWVSWVRSMQVVTGCTIWYGCDQAGTGRCKEEAGTVKLVQAGCLVKAIEDIG